MSRPYREAAWFYAEYRYKPSQAFMRMLAAALGWSSTDRVLDLGAGPAHVSLQLAPFVGEVVCVEPEEEMLEEGRRRAAAAGTVNLSFVQAAAQDLPRLDLGHFAGAVISQALHWMGDQDAVMRDLDPLVDSVAIVGFVKEPDYNRLLLDLPPWDRVEAIVERQLAGTPEPYHPRGQHDPFPDILARSPFSEVELITHEYELEVRPSVDAALGYQYSLSNMLDRLGERRAALEADVAAELGDADTSPIRVRVVDSALVGRRPADTLGEG
jgi:SAM-dependent methyltransferase